MRELVPYLGEKTAKDRIDEIFSREVLGSVVVGSSFFKIIENGVKYYTLGNMDFLLLSTAYIILFLASTVIFAYWNRIMQISEQSQERAKEKAKETQEKIEEATKKKFNSRQFVFDVFSKNVECEIRWKDKN